MIIKDKFISRKNLKELKTVIFSAHFPWYFNKGVNYNNNKQPVDHFQFTHLFYNDITERINSKLYHAIEPIVEKIKPKKILRIKANLLTRTSEIIEHGFHIDFRKKCKTAIFYVNTNNGYTKFENNKVVKSVENRFVLFDSNIKHTGSTCTDQKRRIVINFNYIVW